MPVHRRFPSFRTLLVSLTLSGLSALGLQGGALPAHAESVITGGQTTPHAIAFSGPMNHADATRTALLEEVWQAARLDQLCTSMVENIIAGVREHPDVVKLDADRRQRVVDLYRRQADRERFATRLRAEFEVADEASLHALLAVARSEITARAVRHELAFQPVSMHLMRDYALSVREQPDGAQRLDAIERLDQAIGVTEMSVGVAAASVWGTSLAMHEFELARPAASRDDMDQAIQAFIERVRPFQHEQIQVTYLYLYRNMPVDELREYVALQEAQPVQQLQRRLVRALGEEMIALQRDVTAEVVRGLRAGAEREI